MIQRLTVHLYTAVLFATSTAATFTCPSLFDWYPDTDDCSKFYRCVWGKGQSFTCPTGTLWSQELLTCDYEDHLKCDQDSETEIMHRVNTEHTINHRSSADFSVDFDLDMQSQKESPNDVDEPKDKMEKTMDSKEPVIISEKQDYNEQVTVDDHAEIKPRDLSHVHQHLGNLDIEPHIKYARIMTGHGTENKELYSPTDVHTSAQVHNHDGGTEHVKWDQLYRDNNKHFDKQQEALKRHEKLLPGKYPIQQILDAYLSSQRQPIKQQPPPKHTLQQLQKNVFKQIKNINQSPSTTSIDNARKKLYKEMILRMLLQLPAYTDDPDKPNTLINTDGTYDGMDKGFSPRKYVNVKRYEPSSLRKVESTEPWPLTDFFRAGYGYKRIYL